jgi:signal transduction histidine kinase
MLNKFNEELAENDRNNYLKKIAKTVDYMTELIDNVIFIGKTNVKRNLLNKSKLNIVDFCKNIIEDFKITQKKERVVNLKISTKFDEILIDDKLLKLIITNLLTNASKYSIEEKSIEFNLITDSDFLEIRIKDYGIGIPEKEQNKIFDIFYRAENVGNISGTGLGMAVITESLQILKGEITFKSELGKGTEFMVKIPVKHEKENSHN